MTLVTPFLDREKRSTARPLLEPLHEEVIRLQELKDRGDAAIKETQALIQSLRQHVVRLKGVVNVRRNLYDHFDV